MATCIPYRISLTGADKLALVPYGISTTGLTLSFLLSSSYGLWKNLPACETLGYVAFIWEENSH